MKSFDMTSYIKFCTSHKSYTCKLKFSLYVYILLQNFYKNMASTLNKIIREFLKIYEDMLKHEARLLIHGRNERHLSRLLSAIFNLTYSIMNESKIYWEQETSSNSYLPNV